MPLAAALELIHTYSLIHDDLPAMDDDELRRGRRPATWSRRGRRDPRRRRALRRGVPPHRRPTSAASRARCCARSAAWPAPPGVDGMVGGQYLDVAERAPAGPDGLRRLHALKTGRLIAACVECVLDLSDAGETETMLLGQFAAELGVLFQIVDDILDVTGTDAALGKPSGSDERHGKRTYVSEHGLEQARELATASHARGARRARRRGPAVAPPELEQITDFIYTRTLMTRRPTATAARPHRRPQDLHGLSEDELARVAAGGPRAHHRDGRRDRRPLRREPRHLRAGRRAAFAAGLAGATRSSGTSATRPTRTRS